MGHTTKIDWCDSTWNPVTGCLHGCEYCYARSHVRRFEGYYSYVRGINLKGAEFYPREINFECVLETPLDFMTKAGKFTKAPYPYGFLPTFHKYRLDIPQKWKKPCNIFVCDMADLFGEWVPDEWIKAVFDACLAAPQHRYLFLTKNPERYAELSRSDILPNGDNFWFGATFDHSNWSDNKKGHDPGDFYFPNIYRENTFISFEPLTRNFDIGSTGAKWHIIGAETGNRKDKIVPERGWIDSIVKYCRESYTWVFMKDNLAKAWGAPLIREYPWEEI